MTERCSLFFNTPSPKHKNGNNNKSCELKGLHTPPCQHPYLSNSLSKINIKNKSFNTNDNCNISISLFPDNNNSNSSLLHDETEFKLNHKYTTHSCPVTPKSNANKKDMKTLSLSAIFPRNRYDSTLKSPSSSYSTSNSFNSPIYSDRYIYNLRTYVEKQTTH